MFWEGVKTLFVEDINIVSNVVWYLAFQSFNLLFIFININCAGIKELVFPRLIHQFFYGYWPVYVMISIGGRTMSKFYVAFLPINVRVMVFKPFVPNEEVSPSGKPSPCISSQLYLTVSKSVNSI